MILNCPNCQARFLVADALIPASGRTVRCGSCHHQWHVDNPRGPESIPEPTLPEHNDFRRLLEEETTREEAQYAPTPNVPAIAKKKWPLKPFKIAVPILAALWAIIAFIAYFPAGQNGPLAGLYAMFGATSTQGIAFEDIKMEKVEGETGRVQYVITGHIVNHTENDMKVPLVHITLSDKNGKAIWTRDYPVNITLKAGEKYPFNISDVSTAFADSVKTITIDVGNSFELMVR